MEPNSITVYSSGMADFVRHYPVAGPTSFSIPVREDHIGDVLASIKVFGPVRLVRPPSFTPRDANAGILSIDPNSAMEDLCTKLSGSSVKMVVRGCPEAVSGRLCGVDTREVLNDRGVVREKWISVLVEDSVQGYRLDEVSRFEFADPKAKAEVAKALDANFQKVKQGSTFLELSVEPLEAGKEAVVRVQYMIPLAAPKPTYRISLGKGHQARLELLAVVDNNTDEDLVDFIVAVANGHPVSFTTDLATVRTPLRSHVNVVSDTALGGGDENLLEACADVGGSGPQGAQGRQVLRMASAPSMAYASTSGESCLGLASNRSQAVRDEATPVEVADFQLFVTKTPISIASRTSALVPLFAQDVPSASTVLVYKPRSHATRPFRAVRFTNSTGYSLSKGVCSVFEDGVNVGEWILEDAKPGERKLIPHQLETGVTVSAQPYSVEDRLAHVQISGGTSVSERMRRSTSTYVVRNKKDETFRIYLDHDAVLREGSEFGVVNGDDLDKRVEKTPTGWRVAITLRPLAEVTVETTETEMVSQTVALNESSFVTCLRGAESLRENPKILECLILQEQIAQVQSDIQDCEKARQGHRELTERVSGYLLLPNLAGGQREAYSRDIDDAEKEIRQIERGRLPALQRQTKELREQLRVALGKVVAAWDGSPREAVTA